MTSVPPMPPLGDQFWIADAVLAAVDAGPVRPVEVARATVEVPFQSVRLTLWERDRLYLDLAQAVLLVEALNRAIDHARAMMDTAGRHLWDKTKWCHVHDLPCPMPTLSDV